MFGGIFMYLIYGESFRLIQEHIDKIIKNETNIVTMDLHSVTIEEIITEARYVSLFEEKKFLIVKNAYLFTSAKSKEEDIELLLEYIENPTPLTTLIFTSYEKIDARKKVTKKFGEKNKIINVGDLKTNDLISKVRDYVFNNKYKIDTETIQYIMNACGNNYDLIYNELNKMFLYYMEPQMITLDDVKQIVSKSLQDNHFKFIEAVVSKDIQKAMRILDDLYVLKVDPISLFMLLAREYRLMYSAMTLRSMGYPMQVISKNLGLQDWQTEKSLRMSSMYYKETLASYLKRLAALDYTIKSGEADRFLVLKTFLLEIC